MVEFSQPWEPCALCFCYIANHVTHAHSYAFLVPQPDHLLQATGVIVSEDVASSFNQFKLKQGDFNLRYLIYVIKDKKEVIIEKRGPPDSTYEDFVAALPPDDCRYGLIDLEFESDDGRSTSKLVFISWNPDTASVRSKMLYAGSKEALKAVLIGVGIQINATDHSELDFETSILPVIKKFA